MSLKKWLYKYKYLHAEYSELEEINDLYVTEFDSSFQLDVPKTDDELISKLEDSIIEDSKPVTSSNKSKELYKQLSKHAHPDVGGTPEDFIKVKSLYKSEDILGMIVKAEQYNIDIESMEINYSEEDFEKSCKELQLKCDNIQTTLAWEWAKSSDADREQLVEYYKNALGLIYIKEQ